jgi:hypothetical protein
VQETQYRPSTPSTCVLALALLGDPKCVTNDEESDCDEGHASAPEPTARERIGRFALNGTRQAVCEARRASLPGAMRSGRLGRDCCQVEVVIPATPSTRPGRASTFRTGGGDNALNRRGRGEPAADRKRTGAPAWVERLGLECRRASRAPHTGNGQREEQPFWSSTRGCCARTEPRPGNQARLR